MSFCKNPAVMTELDTKGQVTVADGITRDFLSCGKYYFDGKYNVVTFEAGMTFYHGSARLANSLFAFPVGFNYFNKPHNALDFTIVATDPREIEEIISENSNLTPSWYGDINTAKLYSSNLTLPQDLQVNCQGKCLFAYKLVKDATFLLLNNDYNVVRLNVNLLNETSSQDRTKLGIMFNDNDFKYNTFDQVKAGTVIKATMDSTPLNNVRLVNGLERTSYTHEDLKFTESLCGGLFKKYGYAGYVGSSIVSPPPNSTYFHPEIVFCNPFKYLKRDLENPYDWQHNAVANIKQIPILKPYIDYIKKFKTTNVNFQSGNLYEHSVWALLWTEYLCKEFKINDEHTRILSFTSFIHDVGKSIKQYDSDPILKDPYPPIPPNGDYVYFDVLNHPRTGYELVKEEKLPTSMIDRIDIKKLLTVLNIPPTFSIRVLRGLPTSVNTVQFMAHLIFFHRYFGDYVLKNMNDTSSGADIDQLLIYFVKQLKIDTKKYINPNINLTPYDHKEYIARFIESCMTIGVADSLSSIPYGIGRLDSKVSDINKISTTIPSIANVPALYRGNRENKEFSRIILINKFKTVLRIFYRNLDNYIAVWQQS